MGQILAKDIMDKLDVKARKMLTGDKLVRYLAWVRLGELPDLIAEPHRVKEAMKMIDEIRGELFVHGKHNQITIKK
jgi:hypothetical protein